MKTYRIATIPGDGIGKEVVPAGRSVLEAIAADSGFALAFEDFGWGGDWFRAHGEMMPADGLDALRDKDAILFGSAGDPHIPTTSRCGACASRSARDSTSTPTCGRPASCPASTRR
jgi:tartrate dehydrogenase/decarboxylase/D-malate dehydrogenase